MNLKNNIIYNVFLIKYSEIAIKGKNRYIFENMLLKRIKYVLKYTKCIFNILKEHGRIYLYMYNKYNYNNVINKLKNVFGIHSICPSIIIYYKTYKEFIKNIIFYIKKIYCNNEISFKVNIKKIKKNFFLNSMQLNAELGKQILNVCDNMKVNIHKPDININIEIRKNTYMYFYEISGINGMPIGVSGKAMLLISGGIDSPVAGYMISKRGVKIYAIYFHAPPYTNEYAKQKVINLVKLLSNYSCGTIFLNIINFTQIQLYIYKKCPHDELTIIMRRYMMKISEIFAKKYNCLSLITGDSIGQVASQTMQSIFVVNDICTIPVLRPLISFDKQEIINIALKINTYNISILPYNDCCTIFVPKHPVTKPNLISIQNSEKKLHEKISKLIQNAVNTSELIICK